MRFRVALDRLAAIALAALVPALIAAVMFRSKLLFGVVFLAVAVGAVLLSTRAALRERREARRRPQRRER